MRALLLIWYEMCLLRKAPQDLAASPYLLMLGMVFYGVMDLLVALPGSTWRLALGLTFLDMVVLWLLTSFVLMAVGKKERIVQALTALAGTGALLGVVALPLVMVVQQDPVPALAALLWMGLLAWNLAVRAHVLRHALSAPFGVGLVLSALYAVVVVLMIQWLFPVTS